MRPVRLPGQKLYRAENEVMRARNQTAEDSASNKSVIRVKTRTLRNIRLMLLFAGNLVGFCCPTLPERLNPSPSRTPGRRNCSTIQLTGRVWCPAALSSCRLV